MRSIKLKKFQTRRQDDDASNWQLSLADMMTLILCFFLIIISVSRLDVDRYSLMVDSLEKALLQTKPSKHEDVEVSGEPKGTRKMLTLEEALAEFIKPVGNHPRPQDIRPPLPDELASLANLHRSLEDLKNTLISLFPPELGVVGLEARDGSMAIVLRERILFDLGSAELKPNSEPILAAIADSLKNTNNRLTIEGHTDDLPISSFLYPSNWELSTARASRVARFMIEMGIDPKRIQVTGLADTTPVLPNKDDSGRDIPANQAQNRRVVILVSPGDTPKEPYSPPRS